MTLERITYYEIKKSFINCVYHASLDGINSATRGSPQPYYYSTGCASYEFEGVYNLPVEQLMLALVELVMYSDRQIYESTKYCKNEISQILITHNLDELLADVPDKEKNAFLSDLNLLEITNNADILQTLATSDFKHQSNTLDNDGWLYEEIIDFFSVYIYSGCLEKIKLTKKNPDVKLPINYSTHYALKNYKRLYTRPVEQLMLAMVKLGFAVDTELNSAIPQIQDEINKLLEEYQLDELQVGLSEYDRAYLSGHIKDFRDASLIKA